MGSVQFKVYVSTSNTKDLIQFVAINTSSQLKSTLKCELIEPHNTLKKPFTTKTPKQPRRVDLVFKTNKLNIRMAGVCANSALHSAGCSDVAVLPRESSICQIKCKTSNAV